MQTLAKPYSNLNIHIKVQKLVPTKIVKSTVVKMLLRYHINQLLNLLMCGSDNKNEDQGNLYNFFENLN